MSGASVVESLGIVASLLGVEAGRDLWLFARRLLLAKVKRDIFNGIDDLEVKFEGLNYEKVRVYKHCFGGNKNVLLSCNDYFKVSIYMLSSH